MKMVRKSIVLSIVSFLVSCMIFVSTTFAWFTDSVVNTGNTIKSGNLAITATAYDLGTGGQSFTIAGVNSGNPMTFEAVGQDLKADKNPIIKDTLWEPGISSAKLLDVKNTGSLAAKIKLDFNVTNSELINALWFDFVMVDMDTGSVVGTFAKRPMSEINTIAQNLELKLAANGGRSSFIFVYGMNEEAGNEFKDKSFALDVSLIATQDTVESDGFNNNQYDKDAEYGNNVISVGAADFRETVENAKPGSVIKLTEDVLNETIILIDPDMTIDLDGNKLTGMIQIQQNDQANTVIIRNGVIESDGYYSPIELGSYYNSGKQTVILENVTVNNPQSGGYNPYFYAIMSYGIFSIDLNNCTVTGSLNFTDIDNVTINGGTYTAVPDNGDIALFYINNNIVINDAVLNLNGLDLSDSDNSKLSLNNTKVNP